MEKNDFMCLAKCLTHCKDLINKSLIGIPKIKPVSECSHL